MRTTMLIIHFIGLAMGLGTSFAHAFIGFAASKWNRKRLTNSKHLHQLLAKWKYRTNPFNYFWYIFSLSAITSYNGNAFTIS